VSWATTEVPEITAAIQSFLNAGFRSAAQVECVAIIGDEDRHPLERRRGSWVSGILFVNAFFIRYCRSEDSRFGETRGSVARRGRPSSVRSRGDRPGHLQRGQAMKIEDRRVCSSCGNEFSEAAEFCPVCMLQRGIVGDAQSGGSSLECAINTTSLNVPQRFEHYQIMTGDDGKTVELGRGAMAITYKAFDVDLRCPVTLKVINERYLENESARLRFLREARAAASVRHPNVASVFHLGRTGENYFYAMEFVEGETLETLIRRTGHLEVKLALEIATQVVSGLAAVHKQKLVHRDIKPSNIMVSFEDEGAVTAKIIDLGLAKAVNEPGSQSAISKLGGFAGTPEFASPEQFAGVGVDIRSDLYSLGVTLWRMLTGYTPFRGLPAELMYQHQHAALPLEELEGVPQPVALLIEVLLAKDPQRRFQTPAEFLKVMSTITGAIDGSRTITYQDLRQRPAGDSYATLRRPSVRPGPEKISIARLPVTRSSVFGREEDVAFLNDAWANQNVNIVTIVAWAGIGKSTLVNHWLRGLAAQHYRSAEHVYGWSFYRQGTAAGSSSAEEFVDAALNWFGDPDPRIGTAWEKGERLAKLVSHRRTLLVLDGLEPLQNPPGPEEGRVRDISLQALLRELAAFNSGLCVVTTRLPIADIADHEGTSVLSRELGQLSSDTGAKLLRALGVKGDETELRSASQEFEGHCLALTLLGSYLTDAYDGDIRYRTELSGRLAHDIRQGVHVRKVMESYQAWFGEGPELSVLRLLGLFDRPADEDVVSALLKPPAIPGLTESLTNLSPTKWRMILTRLRSAGLVAEKDPNNQAYLDAHPLVREYFAEQLRNQQTDGWKECNRRLFYYYQGLVPPLPENIKEMEPLFLAVICGCNAGLFREALHNVYIARIQRGNASFAANVLGARGALLSVIAHFFEDGHWGFPSERGVEGQSLTAEDQLFIIMQAGLYLTATRGHSTLEVRICYERAESLCRSLDRPFILFSALIGQWRNSLVTAKLASTMQIANRAYVLAQKQNDAALLMGAFRILAVTLFFLGRFKVARRCASRGVQLWRTGGIQSRFEEVNSPAVVCMSFEALCDWHFGEIASCRIKTAGAISLAKELSDTYASAVALFHAAFAAHFQGNVSEVEHLASELIELSTRQHFAQWRAGGKVFLGWARSASGSTAEGITWIEEAIGEWRAPGSTLIVPYWLALKTEALRLADRLPEGLVAVREAEALAEASGERWWLAELYRLRGTVLTTMGADEAQIEEAFCKAISTAKRQKSISLAARAEATYAEYRSQTGRV
jgi:serine/threonine protein kinase